MYTETRIGGYDLCHLLGFASFVAAEAATMSVAAEDWSHGDGTYWPDPRLSDLSSQADQASVPEAVGIMQS